MRRFLQRSIVLAFVFLAFLALAAGISSVRSAPLDELHIDWATYNPVSYLIEGVRSLIIKGWDAQALALGFGFASLLVIISLALAGRAMRSRLVRT